MAEKAFQRLRRFLAELKRRKVYRVGAMYAAVAFVVVQAANLVFPALNIPSWAYSLVVVLALLGFPVAVVLAWAFEVTPEGVRRTPEAEPAEEAPEAGAGSGTGYRVLVGLGLAAAAVAGGWYLTGGGGDAEPTAGDRSIAVLPFEALGQQQPGAFTEGMHDDLLARLSNVSGLKVISRTSVQQYRDTDKTTAEIARELGVRWVLEGGVQEMGDRIQVNAQLIDPRTDTHAWAESYQRDRTAQSLFELQGEITRRIARSLEAQLSREETDRVERRPTEDMEAYRLYVQGRSHLKQRTDAGSRRAADYFGRAVRQDSSFALAWVGLADAAILRGSYGYDPLADSLRVDPERAVRRALGLDSTLAEAHATLGNLYLDTDLPGAFRRLQRAVDLKPSYARAHHWLGMAFLAAGRTERAVSAAERAVALDPLSPINRLMLGGSYYSSGRLEEALSEVRRAGDLAPDWAFADLMEGLCLTAVGEQPEGLRALTRGLERSSSRSVYATVLRAWPAVAHHQAGDTARAQELLDSYPRTPSGYFDRAAVHAARGESQEALDALERAELTDNVFRVVIFRNDPVFEPLRGTGAYRAELRDVNRTLGLNPDGSLPDGANLSYDARSDR